MAEKLSVDGELVDKDKAEYIEVCDVCGAQAREVETDWGHTSQHVSLMYHSKDFDMDVCGECLRSGIDVDIETRKE